MHVSTHSLVVSCANIPGLLGHTGTHKFVELSRYYISLLSWYKHSAEQILVWVSPYSPLGQISTQVWLVLCAKVPLGHIYTHPC